jgi:hypothetical protein
VHFPAFTSAVAEFALQILPFRFTPYSVIPDFSKGLSDEVDDAYSKLKFSIKRSRQNLEILPAPF